MKHRGLSEAEYALMIEEEKRLCTPMEIIAVKYQAGISIREGAVVDKERHVPGLKLKKIEKKRSLQTTDSKSTWTMYFDKPNGDLVLFLGIEFPRVKRKYRFCFELSTKLKKANVPPVVIPSAQGPFLFEVLEADERTSEALNWLEALIKSDGEIALMDDKEPSVGITGINNDVPRIILMMYGWKVK